MASTARALPEQRRLPALHPDLEHALAGVSPNVAAQAERVITAALCRRLEQPGGGWGGSRLTGDGFPFELAFSTSDDRLRFTLDPGAEGLEARGGLERACAAVADAVGVEVEPDAQARLAALQAGAPLQYGAWLGCRIGEEGVALKLYAEVPAGQGLDVLGTAIPALADRRVEPQMVGYAIGAGVLESYLRVPSLEPRHLPAVLAPVGLEGRAGALLAFVEEAYGYAVRDRLPGPSVGLSYLDHPAARRVTLHFYARALWGSDARIRRGFARLATSLGWDAGAYLAATAPLAGRETWRTCHGILGITLEGEAPPALTIGLRPVAP